MSKVVYKLNGRVVSEEEFSASGDDTKFQEMLASRRFPGVNGTNSAFMSGRLNGNQFEKCPWLGDEYRRLAEARSPGCTQGAYRMASIATDASDPEAWVKSNSDVLAVCRKRNLNAVGMVNHKAHEMEPIKDTPLSESIIQEETVKRLAVEHDGDPRRASKSKIKKTREDVKTQCTPHWAKE